MNSRARRSSLTSLIYTYIDEPDSWLIAKIKTHIDCFWWGHQSGKIRHGYLQLESIARHAVDPAMVDVDLLNIIEARPLWNAVTRFCRPVCKAVPDSVKQRLEIDKKMSFILNLTTTFIKSDQKWTCYLQRPLYDSTDFYDNVLVRLCTCIRKIEAVTIIKYTILTGRLSLSELKTSSN